MATSRMPVALVTGASSGIGEKTALALADAGFIVYGAARRIDRMIDLEAAGIRIVSLDVTDQESTETCVQTILDEHGRIDALVNNAGYGSYGAIEDVDLDEARRQFEVNIFGLARLIKLTLPAMRAQRSGTIVNISSVGGKIFTPFGGWYHSTKHALEGLSDCLRLEAEPFGINVVVVEPGGIKTEWGTIAAENLKKTSGSGAYATAANRAADQLNDTYTGDQLSDPQVIADTIVKACTTSKPRTRYAVGFMAKPAVTLRKVLPDRVFDRIARSMG